MTQPSQLSQSSWASILRRNRPPDKHTSNTPQAILTTKVTSTEETRRSVADVERRTIILRRVKPETTTISIIEDLHKQANAVLGFHPPTPAEIIEQVRRDELDRRRFYVTFPTVNLKTKYQLKGFRIGEIDIKPTNGDYHGVILHPPYYLTKEELRKLVLPFGTILEDRFVETEGVRTGAYHFQLQLHEGSRVPNIIYLDGDAIGVTNKSARKQCTWCHNYGHLQRQCQKKKNNWISQLERQAYREVDGMDWAATNPRDTQSTGINLSPSQSQHLQSTGINLTDDGPPAPAMQPPPPPPKPQQKTSPEVTDPSKKHDSPPQTQDTTTPSTSRQQPKDNKASKSRSISDLSDFSTPESRKGRQRSASALSGMTISTTDQSAEEEEETTTTEKLTNDQLREPKFCNKAPQVVPSCDPATLETTPISEADYHRVTIHLEAVKHQHNAPEDITRSMVASFGHERWEDYRTEFAYRNADPTDEEFQYFEEVYEKQYTEVQAQVHHEVYFGLDLDTLNKSHKEHYTKEIHKRLNAVLKDIFNRRLQALCRRKWPPKDDS